jgi:predicted DNA-binding transcriptional regulator YafY
MRADRLLSILLLLQANGRMTAQSLARRLEVSERTILRDMDALSGAGVPVTAERGVGGGWRLLDGYQTKLTGLTATEIQSLFLARPPKLMADLGLQEAAEAAWIKLQASLPVEVRSQAEFVRQRIMIDARGWRDSAESISSLPILLEALWRGRRVRFDYARSEQGETERVVDPLGLVARGNAWYLVADKGDQRRTYRVSRIANAALRDEAGRRPAEFNLAEHWERSATEFRDKLPRYHATFLADPEVMPWIRYRGRRLETETLEGSRFRIRVRFDVMEEALHFALAYGAAVEVCEPEELRERVCAAAAALLRRYRESALPADPRVLGAMPSLATSARAAAPQDP